MITTRQVNVNLSKGKLKLRHVTTKDIDAGVRVEPPKEPIKTKSITTTTLPDVADMAEKKRRDDIAAERKLAIKDEKKIVMVEEKESPVIKVDEEEPLVKADYMPSEKVIEMIRKETRKAAQKKPLKLMTAEEKKLAMKERMAKVRAAKAKKKK